MKYLYQITLPLYDNDGMSTHVAISKWEHDAARLAGGFSRWDVTGHWIGPDARLHVEENRAYQVGCYPEIWAALIATALFLFPDQQELFIASVGTVQVYSKGEKNAYKNPRQWAEPTGEPKAAEPRPSRG